MAFILKWLWVAIGNDESLRLTTLRKLVILLQRGNPPQPTTATFHFLRDLTSSHLQHVHRTRQIWVLAIVMDANYSQFIHLPPMHQARSTEVRFPEVVATTGSSSSWILLMGYSMTNSTRRGTYKRRVFQPYRFVSSIHKPCFKLKTTYSPPVPTQWGCTTMLVCPPLGNITTTFCSLSFLTKHIIFINYFICQITLNL
jgi:hypothetical protein